MKERPESREQRAESRSRGQRAEGREQRAESREQRAESREQRAEIIERKHCTFATHRLECVRATTVFGQWYEGYRARIYLIQILGMLRVDAQCACERESRQSS
jgi:hypothetical protein